MINFKQVELSDKKDIDKSLSVNTYRSCDFCFTNMYAWNAKFKTLYSIKNDTLFLRFNETDGNVYYMMPIGTMNLKKAFDEVFEDAKKSNIPFLMKGITTRMWEDIESAMPGVFNYTHDRNNDEYIYLSNNLITLSGKKYQSKRNHINRFKADNPDWEYFPITTMKEALECLDMLNEWEDEKTGDTSKTLRYDYLATKIMLENMNVLELRGGAIRVNGKIVAFSVGERLVDDTFVVHVEKAFSDMNGAYTIINQQFAENEAFEYTYINREEDMGLESLRKAKMSYHPDILLQEGILTLK
ncbi:MAG: DUF2156 domain-containing protein [Dysgonomonas sp.]